ncbi:MAG: hypothetical protein ACYC36_03780 [Bellilinea sp.]
MLVYLLLALAILVALSAIAAAIYKAGEKSMKAEWDAEVERQRKAEVNQGNAASTKLEVGNAESKIVFKTITKRVDKYIDRPVYRNICFDADGLRDANAALIGKATAPGEPDKPVRGPVAAR